MLPPDKSTLQPLLDEMDLFISVRIALEQFIKRSSFDLYSFMCISFAIVFPRLKFDRQAPTFLIHIKLTE